MIQGYRAISKRQTRRTVKKVDVRSTRTFRAEIRTACGRRGSRAGAARRKSQCAPPEQCRAAAGQSPDRGTQAREKTYKQFKYEVTHRREAQLQTNNTSARQYLAPLVDAPGGVAGDRDAIDPERGRASHGARRRVLERDARGQVGNGVIVEQRQVLRRRKRIACVCECESNQRQITSAR
jgi:hypothetical protein